MMTRGAAKRLLREAARRRIRAERDALRNLSEFIDLNRVRLEERSAIEHLRDVPSVFAFAEALDPVYERPLWASQRYGAR